MRERKKQDQGKKRWRSNKDEVREGGGNKDRKLDRKKTEEETNLM